MNTLLQGEKLGGAEAVLLSDEFTMHMRRRGRGKPKRYEEDRRDQNR